MKPWIITSSSLDTVKAYYEFEGWGMFLGTNRIANQNKEFWSYEVAKTFLEPLNIRSKSHFVTLCKNGVIPEEIPRDTCVYYKQKETWKSYKDLFGN